MGSKQLSVVIATFNDEPCLYLTVMAVLQQLVKTPLEWEIIIAADGGSAVKWESLNQPWLMSHPIRCIRLGAGNRTGSPQGTRDIGIRAAKFRNVLCIESHVVVSDIEEFLGYHTSHPDQPAISFPMRLAEGTEMYNIYGSTTDWDGNLWFKRLLYQQPSPDENYPIAQFGHSAFMIDRDWYYQSGGYTNLLSGWGGEEPFLCLKAWMLGRKCIMFPRIWHAHYLTAGAHGDDLDSARLTRNFQIVKFVIGGAMFLGCHQAEFQAERQRIVSGPFHGDLSELRRYFAEQRVVN